MNMKDRIERAYSGKPSPDREAEEKEALSGKHSSAFKPAPLNKVTGSASRPGNAGALPSGNERAHSGKSAAQDREPPKAQPASSPEHADAASEDYLKTGDNTGITKAAKFLVLLGSEEAAKVIAQMSPAEVEAVSREIIKINSIDSIEANDILTEFGWLAKTKGADMEGGPETARKILSTAFGEEKARALMMKAAPETLKPFRFLNDFEPRDLLMILKQESPQVLAVIMPYLEPARASGLLELMPDSQRVEVVKRIAHLDKIAPQVIHEIEEGLKLRIKKLGDNAGTEEIDGRAALAGILKHADPRIEAEVLDALEEDNPDLSKEVREKLFTLDDVFRVRARDLQEMLRGFDDRDLALVLKGRTPDFKEKILAAVSRNRRTAIEEEYQILGPVRREDAAEATRTFLERFKKAWKDGSLHLDGDDEYVE